MNTAVADQRGYRLTSIDMLRGLVIVIMAIDHTRDFFSMSMSIDPMADPNAGLALALTRWITHFCAPVFVFLAGTSAGLMAARKAPAVLARFLLTRGVWLIFVEIFLISTAATYAPGGIEQLGGKTLAFMQVIWAIGASMVVLSALQFLGRKVCLALGVSIVLGHNALDGHWPVAASILDTSPPLWAALHVSMSKVIGPFHALFLYPLLPWLGVMLLGFGASVLFEREADARRRALIGWGFGVTALFLVLRLVDGYGESNHWAVQDTAARTLIDFLNVTKYPPSLEFLAMTLGPAAILCAFAERWRGALKDFFVMFGRVPFAFYVAHFFLLHALSLVLGALQGVPVRELMTFPPFYPKNYGLSLPMVYAVWVLVIALLYPLCRWMAGVKARSRAWWLSYL
ncbi:MAG TPA: heparan-alpha-glucosaminide N-acetyltransferase domain-containing protein [Steroidobacteraceae bacterium]|nr:heparan-alpha-glucosaminide N-acetyltransferase domain-containing protein [Steroidobacteraceae bacterium]